MMTPQEKIQEILDKCSEGDYIFRGENKKHKKISSGLYRQYCQSNSSNIPLNDGEKTSIPGDDYIICENKEHDSPRFYLQPQSTKLTIDNENFSILEVEKDIIQKAKRHIRPDAPNIEILTELQHYGGKTALLDFSENIHVALFFACDGNFNDNGRVILFKRSKAIEATDIDYKKMDENKGKPISISPTGKSPRVIFQSSIFVHVSRGYLEENRCEIIEIEKDIKKLLLKYLSKYFNISTESIYNDIQGFIGNQHNYSNSSIEFYRGWTKQKEKKFEEAIEHYNKAIELNHQLFEAYYNRGAAKNVLGKHKEAIKDYSKVIEFNPKYVDAYYNRGNSKNALGNHKDAIKDYDKAIELNPKYANAYYNRGNANSALDQHKEAIKDYDKAIELNPQYATAYNNRGNANSVLGNYDKAIKDYDKAIELNPKYATAYNNRGIANTALGHHEDAIKDYSKAIKVNPKYSDAYNNRGTANADLKNYEDAIKDYGKAKKLYEKEDNMEMAKQCEKAIERLKN